jgi:hypothetical protein
MVEGFYARPQECRWIPFTTVNVKCSQTHMYNDEKIQNVDKRANMAKREDSVVRLDTEPSRFTHVC